MKLTVREKNFIIAAATVLICTLAVIYLILPLRARYMHNQAALRETRDRFEQMRAEKSVRKASVNDLDKLTLQLADYQKQLPLETESSELLYYLNQAAEKSGVHLEKFEYSGTKESLSEAQFYKKVYTTIRSKESNIDLPKGTRSISFKVRVMGNYKQVKDFLIETEELKRIVYNKSITVNNSENLNTLECLIEFATFVKQDDEKTSQPKSKPDTERKSDIPGTETGRESLFEE